MHFLIRFVPLCCSAIVVLSAPGFAQTVSNTAGAINGTVTDSTKAVLPGVTVTLSGSAVMGAPSTTTTENGSFRFSAVPPESTR